MPCPSLALLAPRLQPCTTHTTGSGRGIPARQSFHHRYIYWPNLFPGIEETSRKGGFSPSVRGAEGRRGRDISTRRTKPAANIY